MNLNQLVRQLGAMALILSLTGCGEAIAEMVIIEFAATISESPVARRSSRRRHAANR